MLVFSKIDLILRWANLPTDVNSERPIIPGHGFSLHVSDALTAPAQGGLAALAAVGTMHWRTLERSPPPQDREQSVHSDHSVQYGHSCLLHPWLEDFHMDFIG